MDSKCAQCGKEFPTAHGLVVHTALTHSAKSAAKAKTARKAGRPAGKGKGKYVCDTCGRTFGMGMHLARHVYASHQGARKAGPKAGRAVAGADSIVVADLSIDALLALKQEVDQRLAVIARKMKQAKVT
jgi:DNA-directed RNA polymerase subunit RPC12/RpoP